MTNEDSTPTEADDPGDLLGLADEVVGIAAGGKSPRIEGLEVLQETPRRAQVRRFAATMRSIIDDLVSTTATADELDEASDRLEEIARLIAALPSGQEYQGFAEAANAGAAMASGMGDTISGYAGRSLLAEDDPERFAVFDHSPFIGLANPLSPPMRLRLRIGSGDRRGHVRRGIRGSARMCPRRVRGRRVRRVPGRHAVPVGHGRHDRSPGHRLPLAHAAAGSPRDGGPARPTRRAQDLGPGHAPRRGPPVRRGRGSVHRVRRGEVPGVARGPSGAVRHADLRVSL